MSLRPVVIVGCGGSGGKTVQMLRHSLRQRLVREGLGSEIPDAWQFLYIDTPETQETNVAGVGPLPDDEYVRLSEELDSYKPVFRQLTNFGKSRLDRLDTWVPNPKRIKVSLQNGAGQMRAVGRAVSLSKFGTVGTRLRQAYLTAAGASAELAELQRVLAPEDQEVLVAGDDPFVFVVSSMAGGTGAGVFLDVCDAFRAVTPAAQNKIFGVLFTAEVFQGPDLDADAARGLQPNSLGLLSELISGYYARDREIEPLASLAGMAAPQGAIEASGPSYPFVVGMQTMGGSSLEQVHDCYRAVSETLLAMITSPPVARNMTQFTVANWQIEQVGSTAWAFGDPDRNNEALAGIVSSFGSARLSLGLERFETYAAARVARSVIEFQLKGWEQFGRDRFGLSDVATAAQIATAWGDREGLAFVERCGLRELNEHPEGQKPVPYDQVIEAIAPEQKQQQLRAVWRAQVVEDLTVFGEMAAAEWIEVIPQRCALRESSYVAELSELTESGSIQFRDSAPSALVLETSRAVAAFGLRPARCLVDRTAEHLRLAKEQLTTEVASDNLLANRWREFFNPVFRDVPNNLDPVDTDHRAVLDLSVKAYAVKLGAEGRVVVKQRAIALIDEFLAQVIAPLLALIDQMERDLDEASNVLAGYPGDRGVPASFEPPPFEHCLIESDRWPAIFEDKVSATAEQDDQSSSWQVSVRSMVGGGGFEYTERAATHLAPSAVMTAAHGAWRPRELDGDGTAVALEQHFRLPAIEQRASLWLHRQGTASERFITQTLTEYLDATDDKGLAILDHTERLKTFVSQLQLTLAAAKPLVNIDPVLRQEVHPENAANRQVLVPEQLPLAPGHPARDRAEQVIRQALPREAGQPGWIDAFFTAASSRAESITYVSRLSGAVHPACISSVVEPIAASLRDGNLKMANFWSHRRSRPLEEFVPVHESVLHSMIRGWFVGRMFGLVPNPSRGQPFNVLSESGECLRFPSQLLRKVETDPEFGGTSWLPLLLESLPVAMILYGYDQQYVQAYDRLFELGGSIGRQLSQSWIVTGSSPAAQDPCQITGSDSSEPGSRSGAALALLDGYGAAIDTRLRDMPLEKKAQLWFAEPGDFGRELFPLITSELNGDMLRRFFTAPAANTSSYV